MQRQHYSNQRFVLARNSVTTGWHTQSHAKFSAVSHANPQTKLTRCRSLQHRIKMMPPVHRELPLLSKNLDVIARAAPGKCRLCWADGILPYLRIYANCRLRFVTWRSVPCSCWRFIALARAFTSRCHTINEP